MFVSILRHWTCDGGYGTESGARIVIAVVITVLRKGAAARSAVPPKGIGTQLTAGTYIPIPGRDVALAAKYSAAFAANS